jgi:hypothetical protein
MEGWLEQRSKVKVTAKRFYSLLSFPGEHSTYSAVINHENAHFVFGEEMEPFAREYIEQIYAVIVTDVGKFFQNNMIGAKIDGIIHGLKRPYVLEIKCVTTEHFVEKVRVTDAYQLWIGCYCSGIDDGMLCYWHPNHGIQRYDTTFPREWWEQSIQPLIIKLLDNPNRKLATFIRKEIQKKIIHRYQKIVESPYFTHPIPVSPLRDVVRKITKK